MKLPRIKRKKIVLDCKDQSEMFKAMDVNYYHPYDLRIENLDFDDNSDVYQGFKVQRINAAPLLGASSFDTAIYKASHINTATFKQLEKSKEIIESKFHAGQYDADPGTMALIEEFIHEIEELAKIQNERNAINDKRINAIKEANCVAYNAVYEARREREAIIDKARIGEINTLIPDYELIEQESKSKYLAKKAKKEKKNQKNAAKKEARRLRQEQKESKKAGKYQERSEKKEAAKVADVQAKEAERVRQEEAKELHERQKKIRELEREQKKQTRTEKRDNRYEKRQNQRAKLNEEFAAKWERRRQIAEDKAQSKRLRAELANRKIQTQVAEAEAEAAYAEKRMLEAKAEAEKAQLEARRTENIVENIYKSERALLVDSNSELATESCTVIEQIEEETENSNDCIDEIIDAIDASEEFEGTNEVESVNEAQDKDGEEVLDVDVAMEQTIDESEKEVVGEDFTDVEDGEWF